MEHENIENNGSKAEETGTYEAPKKKWLPKPTRADILNISLISALAFTLTATYMNSVPKSEVLNLKNHFEMKFNQQHEYIMKIEDYAKDANDKIASLDAQVLEYQEKIKSLNDMNSKDASELIEFNTGLQEERNMLASSLEKIIKELDEVKSSNQSLMNENSQKDAEIEKISKELEKTVAEFDKQVEAYRKLSTERSNNMYDFELDLERQLEDEMKYEEQGSLFLDHLSYQVADSGLIMTDASPIYQGVEEPEDVKKKIEFITDRGDYSDFPYIYAVVNKETNEVFKVFARPTQLKEDASSDGKGIWLSSHLNAFAYTFSPQEQKIVEYRRQRDPDFARWFDGHTSKVIKLCGAGCQLQWVDAELLQEGDLEVADKPIRDAGGAVAHVNTAYDPEEGVLSFDDPAITQTITEMPSQTLSEAPEERIKGWRVTAFSTAIGEGAVDYKELDISKGIQLTYGPLAQWNETDGVLWTSRGTKIAPFPYSVDTVYATVADGFLNIEENGTYEFALNPKEVSPNDVALYVNNKLVWGGGRSIPIPIDMEAGEFPIKLTYFVSSQNSGVVDISNAKPTEEVKVEVRDLIRDYDKYQSLCLIFDGTNKTRTCSARADEFYNKSDKIKVRGKQFIVGYRKLTRDGGGFKSIREILTSIKAPEQTEGRISKPISEMEYKYYTPTAATTLIFNKEKNLSYKLNFALDAYATNYETGESIDGLLPVFDKNSLVEFEFEYDARVPGVHYFLPYLMSVNPDSYDDDKYNFSTSSINEWDTLNIKNMPSCKYEFLAYDSDVSQYVPIMQGYKAKGIAYTYNETLGQDYYGHINVTEPTVLEIKGRIVCAEEFSLKMLTKDPRDNQFRPFED